MHTRSCGTQFLGTGIFPDGMRKEGDFVVSLAEDGKPETLYIVLPGDTDPTAILLDHPSNDCYPSQVPKWKFDENSSLQKPTITPSIHWIGKWHGFLTNGELKSC